MGLFDWAGDAWNGATHLAGDAWNGVTSVASDAWNGLSTAAGDVGGWLGDAASATWDFLKTHWKTIAAVAAGTVAFVLVATFAPELLPGLFALAPDLAPWLVLGGAGAASGAATRAVDDWTSGRTPGWDVLTSAAITGVFTVVTAGTLQWLAPQIGEAVPFLKPLTDRFAVSGAEAADGAGATDPIITVPRAETPVAPVEATPPEATPPEDPGAPSVAGGPDASSGSGGSPGLTPLQALARAPKTRGIIGLITGDAGNKTDAHMDRERREHAR